MSNIEIFSNPKFGDVRTLEINDEPWFVGKDIAEALGYERPTKAIQDRVDDDDKEMVDGKTQSQFGIELGQRGGWLINESGLYSLVLSSKLPEAKEFKHWITHDVIPAIRRTGGYSLQIPQTLPEALRAYADEVEAHEHTKQVLEIAKPKAKVYDEFVDIDHTIGFRELANELKVSEKELRGMLDDNGWYYKAGHGKRKPYKWVITEGYMKAGDVKSGEWSGVQYRFTMKGRDEVTKIMEVSA